MTNTQKDHDTAASETGIKQAAPRARRAASRLTKRIRRQPLTAVALAVTGGALAGALMPRTRVEDTLVGPHGDRLRDQAADKLRETGGELASAAQEGLATAKADLQQK